jgi:hypothetical protein
MNNRAGHYLARYFLAVVSIVCALAPAAAFATSYLPGQTLDPACTPTDPTCLVVANTAGTFIATSTTATSTFAGNVSVSGNVAIGSLSGILKAIAGVVQTALVNLATDVTGVLGITNGGTGTSTAPTYGQVLVGNASGGYTLLATSSLGIAGGVSLTGTTGQLAYFSGNNTAVGTSSVSLTPSGGLSIQSTGTSTLTDLQGTSQSLFTSWAPRLWQLADGTSLNPVTTSGATFKISRTEAVASTTCNGNNVDNECNAALLVESNSNSSTASSSQQTAAIVATAKGQPIGTDVVGLTGVGDVVGAGTGIGTGAYIEGRRDTTTGKALGAEIRVSNITNTPGIYNPSGFSDTQGLWITASGPVSGAAIAIGHISQFITGLSFTTGSIATTTIEDNSSSVTSLQVNGTHTYGLLIGPNGGRVGIGTLTPGFPLDVLGTSAWDARFQSSGSNRGAIVIDNHSNPKYLLLTQVRKNVRLENRPTIPSTCTMHRTRATFSTTTPRAEAWHSTALLATWASAPARRAHCFLSVVPAALILASAPLPSRPRAASILLAVAIRSTARVSQREGATTGRHPAGTYSTTQARMLGSIMHHPPTPSTLAASSTRV